MAIAAVYLASGPAAWLAGALARDRSRHPEDSPGTGREGAAHGPVTRS